MPKVAVINYGTGNINSVTRRLTQMGASVCVCESPREIGEVDKLVLPGVGHFGRAMERLKASKMLDALNEYVLDRQVPVLGICLGMQLMAKWSEEGDCAGLGWLDAKVVRFQLNKISGLKIPHMGWNQVRFTKECGLSGSIKDDCELYFIHSYHWESQDPSHVLGLTQYGETTFPSVVGSGHILGMQFHPEKSHDCGEALLKEFLKL